MLFNKCRNDGIQCTIERSILCICKGSQGGFVAIIIGTHENNDQICRRNILITADQRLIGLTVIGSSTDTGTGNTHGGHGIKAECFGQILVINLICSGTGGNAVTHKHGASAVPQIFLCSVTSGADTVFIGVPSGIHVRIHVGITARTGVGGITAFGTGGGGSNRFVIMIYSCFCIGMTSCRCLPCSKSNKGYLLASSQFYIRNRYAVCCFWRTECSCSTSATQTKSEVFIIERRNQFAILVIETAYCVGFAQEEHILDPYTITRCYRNQIRRGCGRRGLLHPLTRACGNRKAFIKGFGSNIRSVETRILGLL